MAKLSRDLREFIESLNEANVEFVVIGGHAFSFHARPRVTLDLDVFVRPSEENAQRILRAPRSFGFSDLRLTVQDFLGDTEMIQLGYKPSRIDIVMRIAGVEFDEVWQDRVPGVLQSVPVYFISKPHLIRNKLATGRDQDLVDVKYLREMK